MKNAELSYARSSTIVSLPVLVISLLLCVLAAFFGQTGLAAALMFVFLLALLARLWARLAIEHIRTSVSAPSCGVFPDDELEFSVSIENDKFLPLVWLELFAPVALSRCLEPEDARVPDDWEFASLKEMGAATDIAGEKRFNFVLWYETAQGAMRWKARRRGLYSMADWRVRTGDGFGLTQLELPLESEDVREIAVYPRLVNVRADMFLRNLWNSESGSRGVMEDITVLRSTRDYQTTDSLKHINWRLTARGLPLAVNVYEDILPKSAHFILDGESFAGAVPHPEELEDALSILASLCVRLERMEVRCGLSLPRTGKKRAVNLFAGAVTEELLRAMAAYMPPAPEYDKESGEFVLHPPVFDESAIFEHARHAGRFYYIAYDTDGLRGRSLLRKLGEERTSVLTYQETAAFGNYEVTCLRHLKEVSRNA